MTTADAGGVFPDARARLEYTDKLGVVGVVASVSGTSPKSGTSADADGSRWSIAPSSFLGWVIYVLVIVGGIFLLRKVKGYYEKRKQMIALEEEAARRESASPTFSRGQLPTA